MIAKASIPGFSPVDRFARDRRREDGAADIDTHVGRHLTFDRALYNDGLGKRAGADCQMECDGNCQGRRWLNDRKSFLT